MILTSQSAWACFHRPIVGLAESYENQRFLPLKGWGPHLLPTDRPKWSDKTGKNAQPLNGLFLGCSAF